MNDRAAQTQQEIDRLRAFAPAGSNLTSYLRRLLDDQLAAAAPDETGMGVVPLSGRPLHDQLAAARNAVESLGSPEQLAAEPEGIVALHVISWLLRPALPLADGLIEPPTTGIWKDLAPDVVVQEQRSVCRVDLVIEGYGSQHLGTGFVVGKDAAGSLLVMTNAHVVEAAVKQGWPHYSGLSLACDFARFKTEAGGSHHNVLREYLLHPVYDLALLRFDPASSFDLGANHPPLLIATQPPEPVEACTIAIIGHPWFDSSVDPFPRTFGFGDAFSIKRLSVGQIRALGPYFWRGQTPMIFLHDATTLGGSSGSCIIDMSTRRVVGLHFGGWPQPTSSVNVDGISLPAKLFSANGAVPLWLLADDPLLAGVAFAK